MVKLAGSVVFRQRKGIRSLLCCLLASLLLSGCTSSRHASVSPVSENPDCSQLLADVEQRIETAGVWDAFGQPLASFPYLRSDRLLASFRHELNDTVIFDDWYRQLYRQGRKARNLMLDNLPTAMAFEPSQRQRIERCIDQLAALDRNRPNFKDSLIAQAEVPDVYRDELRWLGLFPISRQVVLNQVRKWQRQWGALFNDPQLLSGSSVIYTPRKGQLQSAVAGGAAKAPLPSPWSATLGLEPLFARHAPVWQVFSQTPADLIGKPVWRGGRVTINTAIPVSYTLPSWTRFEGETLLQLNYVIWFPERAATRALDIYAGLVDGLIWRVTLNPDGSVLLYDTIHPCGCYHLIFPVDPRLQRRQLSGQVEAPLIIEHLIPAKENRGGPSHATDSQRLVLQLIPGSHYLQGIATYTPENERIHGNVPKRYEKRSYVMADYHELRSLPTVGGRRSLFESDALVPGSERLERWLLWPMGVPSAGAQRMWGHHAISFANRRHFDDPYLFESFFRIED